ncbi:MAG: hypothetical protein Q8Q06_02815 [bacterium]|nr:hypothetical protein [bacterium]
MSSILISHPLPWRVEHDCSNDVVAADGTLITSLHYEDDAKMLIGLAEEINRTLSFGIKQAST